MQANKWAVEELQGNMEGYTMEERKQYLEDVRTYGCQSGCVSGVIYYKDTEKLFKENMIEILETISDYEDEVGYNPIPKIVEEGNTLNLYNYLVWFVIEVVAQNMISMLDDEVAEEEA